MSQPTIEETYHLPAGYTLRPPTMDDAGAFTDLINRFSNHLWGTDDTIAEETRKDWTRPGYQFDQSIILLHAPDGQLAGFVSLRDDMNPPVNVTGWLVVHDEHEGLGLESALVNWSIERAKQAIPRCPEDARVTLRLSVDEDYEPIATAYKHAGMNRVRGWYEMHIDHPQSTTIPVTADGYTLRAVDHDAEFRDVIAAMDDAFKDHWGHVDRPLDEIVKMWAHYISGDDFKPEWWQIAVHNDTGEIAGAVIGWEGHQGSKDNAYISTVGVRKNHRQKGLALALLQQTFNIIWRDGKKATMLHVDASSPTGATRLYEKAGMHVSRRNSTYELELRAGVDLSTH